MRLTLRSSMDRTIEMRVDRQRERRFRVMVKEALMEYWPATVDGIITCPDGLLVELKSGESFLLTIHNRTGRDL